MTDMWLTIYEDRHSDVEVWPYTTQEAAIAKAEEWLAEEVDNLDDVEDELTEDMIADGWVYNVIYSSEGDGIRVIRRELDKP